MPDATTLLALGLVLASAGGHASWNLLLKRAQRQEVFVWWLSAFAMAALLPVAIVIALRTPLELVGLWYVAGSALVHICYFLFLGRSLARSDLSLVYPIARGFGPGLAPALAVLTLGESVSLAGWAGIGGIVAGIYLMAWWGRIRLRLPLRRPLSRPDFSRLGRGNAAGIGYALLARSDLSLVYPIARGFGPGLAPALAVLTLGESVSLAGWAGIGGIVAGIYLMAWWGRIRLRLPLRRPLSRPDFSRLGRGNAAGIGYALLTGLCIALYTIVDKQGVAHINPFLYLYLTTVGVAIGMLPYIIRNHGWRAIAGEWRSERLAIPAASGLVYLAYGLALTALRISEVSYVAPAREVGMLFALALGALVLRERITRGRLAGAALIAAGLAVITVFR